MSIVLDASVALSLLFDDEPVTSTDAIIDRANAEGAIVPESETL